MPFDRSLTPAAPAPALLPLSEAAAGARVRIAGVGAGGGVERRLTELGLPRGAEVTVVGRMGRGGPVIVAAHGTRVVIGGDMAGAVLVVAA